jgi:hypothetical protein
MKRTVNLLLVLALVLLAASPAMATSCWTCRFSCSTCVAATASSTERWTQCFGEPGSCECDLQGSPCAPGFAPSVALAAEYQVVAVERLDEPAQPRTDETRVASIALE